MSFIKLYFNYFETVSILMEKSIKVGRKKFSKGGPKENFFVKKI
jgi:hypothetical protein